MKVVCDKCLKIKDRDEAKKWLKIQVNTNEYEYENLDEYILCPSCQDGFWMAVDSELPPVIKREFHGGDFAAGYISGLLGVMRQKYPNDTIDGLVERIREMFKEIQIDLKE